MLDTILNNTLAGRYITALMLKKQGKSIKLVKLIVGYGLGVYFAFSLLLMPSVAHAAPTNVHCNPGEQITDTGIISGVNLTEDNSYQITISLADNNDVAYGLPATQKVARQAGRMIGQQVEFSGKITLGTPGCQFVILTNWHFGKQ